MRVGWIELREFRNYSDLDLQPFSRLNLLIGPNAQGKTNLLEGLAVLLTGRSFRTSRLGEIPRWGAPAASVAGELRRTEGTTTVRRAIRRLEDGTWQGSGEGCSWARVVAFGWQDLEILNGPPAARRSFVDGFAARLDPSHLPALLRFRQVLARRNRVLQSSAHDPSLATRLVPWDEQLVAVGRELVDRRRRAAASLQTELGRVYPALAGTALKVEIRYRASIAGGDDPETWHAALERVRRAEARRGLTLCGPHRDDLAIELDGVDARIFGSRGQQRLLALALRLAEVVPITEAVGTAPVLLLDDALSELDPRVRAHVLREIQELEQVFLTAPEPLPAEGAACWEVRGGGVRAR